MTEYRKALLGNATIRKLRQKAEAGTITAQEMNRLTGEYGKVAGKCIGDLLTEEFPDGDIPPKDVRRTLSPVMKQAHGLIAEAMAMMIDAQYARDGIGLKAVVPEYSKRREDDLVEKISSASFKRVEENG